MHYNASVLIILRWSILICRDTVPCCCAEPTVQYRSRQQKYHTRISDKFANPDHYWQFLRHPIGYNASRLTQCRSAWLVTFANILKQVWTNVLINFLINFSHHHCNLHA